MATSKTHPLEAHFALALVVLKSRPEGVSVDDYILSLRESLSQNGNDDLRNGLVDSSLLWQKLFRRMQRHNLHLRAEIARKGSSDYDNGVQSGREAGSQKPKPLTSPPKQAETQSNRQRTLSVESVERADEISSSSPQQDRDRSLLLRVYFVLSRTDSKTILLNEKTISILYLACDALNGSLDTVNDESLDEVVPLAKPMSLYEACMAIKKMWSLVISKLKEAPQPSTHTTGHTTALPSSLCTLVRALLGRLHQYCLDEADQNGKLAPETKRPRRAIEQTVLEKEEERTAVFKHNCNLVTSTIAHMITRTAKLVDKQPSIFYAIYAVFLEHLGHSLSLSLFADSNNEGDGTGLVPPNGLKTVSHINSKAALLATKLEAPFLVSILRGMVQSSVLERSDKSTKGDPAGPAINEYLLEKLQNTLLGGIFDEQDRPSQPHGNSVNHRPNDLTARDVHQVDFCEHESGSSTWFLSQVWDLLGWDVLMNESALEQ